jgi:probable rRNA maturation factor
MQLDIINTTKSQVPVSPFRLKKWLTSELLTHKQTDNFLVEVYWVGTSKIKKLNNQYRQKNQVTDILSFPVEIKKIKHTKDKPLGTVVLCLPVIKKQAVANSTTVEQEIEMLVRHGARHLVGLHHKEQ